MKNKGKVEMQFSKVFLVLMKGENMCQYQLLLKHNSRCSRLFLWCSEFEIFWLFC